MQQTAIAFIAGRYLHLHSDPTLTHWPTTFLTPRKSLFHCSLQQGHLQKFSVLFGLQTVCFSDGLIMPICTQNTVKNQL